MAFSLDKSRARLEGANASLQYAAQFFLPNFAQPASATGSNVVPFSQANAQAQGQSSSQAQANAQDRALNHDAGTPPDHGSEIIDGMLAPLRAATQGEGSGNIVIDGILGRLSFAFIGIGLILIGFSILARSAGDFDLDNRLKRAQLKLTEKSIEGASRKPPKSEPPPVIEGPPDKPTPEGPDPDRLPANIFSDPPVINARVRAAGERAAHPKPVKLDLTPKKRPAPPAEKPARGRHVKDPAEDAFLSAKKGFKSLAAKPTPHLSKPAKNNGIKLEPIKAGPLQSSSKPVVGPGEKGKIGRQRAFKTRPTTFPGGNSGAPTLNWPPGFFNPPPLKGRS